MKNLFAPPSLLDFRRSADLAQAGSGPPSNVVHGFGQTGGAGLYSN